MKKKTKKTTKDALINVRCTSKQKAELERAAAKEGMSVSTWLLHFGLLAVTRSS